MRTGVKSHVIPRSSKLDEDEGAEVEELQDRTKQMERGWIENCLA